MDFVAPRHVESSRIRDQTCVPCTGRQIPILQAPGKSLVSFLMSVGESSVRHVDFSVQ